MDVPFLESGESGHRGRYRFTVAHEIGHWILHRPLLLEEVDRTDEDLRFATLRRDVDDRTHDRIRSYRPEECQTNVETRVLFSDEPLTSAFTERHGEPRSRAMPPGRRSKMSTSPSAPAPASSP